LGVNQKTEWKCFFLVKEIPEKRRGTGNPKWERVWEKPVGGSSEWGGG